MTLFSKHLFSMTSGSLVYLQVVFQNLGEIVLKFRTTEVLENILPIRRVIKVTQVWLHFTSQNLQSGRLANTVCTNQTQHLARTRTRQTMELERVGRVTVSDFLFQVGGQVDDMDGAKRTLFRTDTTTNAQIFRDECDLWCSVDFDTQFSCKARAISRCWWLGRCAQFTMHHRVNRSRVFQRAATTHGDSAENKSGNLPMRTTGQDFLLR